MKLSHLSQGDVGIFPDAKRGRFIVTHREPEDRASGHTDIEYENGGCDTFLWDHRNPEVEYLGKGQIIPRQVLFP